MSILIFTIIVIVILTLLIWAVRQTPLTQPLKNVVLVLMAVVAALLIAQRAGLI